MAFTIELTNIWQIREGGQFGTGDRTTTYRVGTTQVVGADRHMAQTWTISANLSAQAITLTPLGTSAPGTVFWLQASEDVDVRFQSPNDTGGLSAVRHLMFGGSLSALYLTTGDTPTRVRIEAVGGSNASITTTLPA